MRAIEPARPRGARVVAIGIVLLLLACVAASVLFVWAFWLEWSIGWLGAGLGGALLAVGIALVVIAHRVLPHGVYAEDRPPLTSPPDEQLAFALDFERGGELTRRRFLLYGAVGAFGAFGIAMFSALRSLGPRPDARLTHTPWRSGLRVVNDAGRPVRVSDIPIDGAVTVFPEGFPDSADGQGILVRVGADAAARAKVRPTPDGIYVYSKVCTHMGCPVGQYLAQSHELMCPCHQSIFDVLDSGRPTFGPAARALPLLPVHAGPDGVLVADGDFTAPVGPSFWNLG